MMLDEKMKEIIEKVGSKANAKAVFGEPYEKDGLTIIPVAKVFMSGGGGEGWGKMKKWGKDETSSDDMPSVEGMPDKGMGRGFGGMSKSVPIGYIKIKEGEASFVQTMDKTKIIIGGMVLAGLSLIVMKKLFCKKHKCHHGQEQMPM